MEVKKYRWSKAYESAEEELIDLLELRQIEAVRWTADEYQEFASHMHGLDKKLWCAEGSIIFTVNGKQFSLQPGDGFDLPAYTEHSAIAGFMGTVCYESPAQNPVLPPEAPAVL